MCACALVVLFSGGVYSVHILRCRILCCYFRWCCTRCLFSRYVLFLAHNVLFFWTISRYIPMSGGIVHDLSFVAYNYLLFVFKR